MRRDRGGAVQWVRQFHQPDRRTATVTSQPRSAARWTDLILDRAVTDVQLIDGLARLFAVPPAAVAVIDMAQAATPAADASPAILVESLPMRGPFPLQVSTSLRRADLAAKVQWCAVEEASIAQICAIWQCNCLLSDDDLDPFTWLRMHPDGLIERVAVDADRLAEGSFMIASVTEVIGRVPSVVERRHFRC